jgi:hypothetical protein
MDIAMSVPSVNTCIHCIAIDSATPDCPRPPDVYQEFALRALLSRRESAADTRRKILVGAIVLAKVEQGELEAGRLRGWLDAALTRDDDRALFVDLGVSEPRVAGTVPGRAAD